MQFSSNVVIIGGGITGYLLALILSRANISVSLIEEKTRNSGLKEFDGRAYALSFSSINVLKATHMWGKIKEHSQEIRKMKIFKANGEHSLNSPSLEFDKSDLDGENIAFMVEDRFLTTVLHDALADNINVISNSRAVGFEKKGSKITVDLVTGARVSADLIVAADGKNSKTAKYFGLSRLGWKYNQTSLVSAVSHELPHEGIAYQKFYPSGPFAILPLKGNRSSLVWTESSNDACEIQNLADKDYLKFLERKFGDFLGNLNIIGNRNSFELDLGFVESIIGDRLALVGDSAQNIHPIAGQGLNLGIRDIACLADVVIDSFRVGEDIGSTQVLQRYEKWRRFDSTILSASTDMINRSFSSENKLNEITNVIGMKAVEHTPFIKKLLMYEAMGMVGDLPRLLRGVFP